MSYGTTYTLYSTDGGAPTETRTTGGAIPLFDGFLVTKLGWTKTTWATNQVSYQAPAGTNQRILSLDDTAVDYTIVSGWETLTAWNTGTGQFPTSAQGAVYITRNIYNNALSPLVYGFVGTQAMFHFYHNAANSTGGEYFTESFSFGDIVPYSSTDTFNTIIIGTQTITIGYNQGPRLAAIITSLNGSNLGFFLDRSYTQIGSSVAAGHFTDSARCNSAQGVLEAGNGGSPYPDPVTGSIIVAPMYVTETSQGIIRGSLPGVWAWCHPYNQVPTLSSFTLTQGIASGRTLQTVNFAMPSSTSYQTTILFETSSTWGGY